MALYVYVTEECVKDACRHNRYKEMERLKEKVEKTQRICHFDNFPPPYLKKRFDRQIRLLADYRSITVGDEQHVVVCFLRIFVRGKEEYKNFLKDPAAFGKKNLTPLVEEEELQEFLKEQLRESPIAPPKPSPTEAEHHFLYRLLGNDQNKGADEFVCESERWMQKISEKKIQHMLLHIFEALPDLVNGEPGKTTTEVRNCIIIYRWFPQLNKLFLAGIANSKSEKESIKEEYADILFKDEKDVSEELLLRYSMRNYPALLLADEDGWMDIEKDEESNLALSPEETEVLESVHRDNGYPVFINGRAGSGKSTILYYLFTDYVNLYLELANKHEALHPPILLSCSEELKRRAKETVENLIRCNPRWRDDKVKSQVPSECFQEFHDFLYNLLPESDRESRFKKENYVDYAIFRRIWSDQFGHERKIKKETDPDNSWHILRTYIKGTNPEDYLEPEDYQTLPRKQKSVSQQAYDTVYEKIWDKWYRELCEQQGYWDDQDLARHIFSNDLARPLHPAVFCDEAQDFTRVELDILFRLCLFVDRKLGHFDIARVPFAFAGDPFQTLNPTGFRWDAVQASFHDKLADTFTLGGGQNCIINFNYRELNLNYRSTKNVVRLCNLIQALRAALFDLPNLRPQGTWQMEASSPFPVWFDRNKPSDWEQLQKEKDITIIVPCMLNEEKEFVRKDDSLREVVQTDDSGVPLNVLSPARAKGLEFGRVVLYRFADNAPGDFLGLLDENELSQDRMLPFEYFVNQLYVAASRPKRRLFIIDSQKGRDGFWTIANDESLQKKIWCRIPDGRKIWADDVGGFQIGTRESWNEDRGNPEENAERYEKQGLLSRDPFLLRSAALSYESIEKVSKAKLCKAHALKFEKKYREAGDYFKEAGESEQALSCYWIAGVKAKDDIAGLASAFPDIASRIEFKLMHVLDNLSVSSVVERMNDLSKMVLENPQIRMRLVSEKTFSTIIDHYVKYISSCDEVDSLNHFLAPIESMLDLGLRVNNSILADIYYKTGRLPEAVSCWEKTNNYFTNDFYRKAKASILASKFEKNIDIELKDNEVKLLAEHFRAKNEYLMMLRCQRKTMQPVDLIRAFLIVPRDYLQYQDVVVELVDTLAGQGEWQLVIDLAFVSQGAKAKALLAEYEDIIRGKGREIRNAVIVACAKHHEFSRQNAKLLKQYSDYFKKVISTPEQWRDELSLEVTGAAMERAGRFIDILPFYEKVLDDPSFSDNEKRFARKRWVKTKEKQIDREQEQGNESSAQRHMREVQDKREEYDLGDKSIPDYPSVTTIWVNTQHKPSASVIDRDEAGATGNNVNGTTVDTLEAPKTSRYENENIGMAVCQDVSFEIGQFRFDFSPVKGKINITHKESMDVASIRLDRGRMSSTDVEISNNDGLFICNEWNCECDLSDLSGAGIVKFNLRELNMTLEFRFIQKDCHR